MTQIDIQPIGEPAPPVVPPFLAALVALVGQRKEQLYKLLDGALSPQFVAAIKVEIATLSEVIRVAQKLATPELQLDASKVEAEAATVVPP